MPRPFGLEFLRKGENSRGFVFRQAQGAQTGENCLIDDFFSERAGGAPPRVTAIIDVALLTFTDEVVATMTACAPKNCRRPASWAATSISSSSRRNKAERTSTVKK